MKLKGKEQDIIKKYTGGLSMPQIAKEYNVRHQSIDKLLKRNNITLRDRKEAINFRCANDTKLPNSILEMIDGWLLGDGSIIDRDTQQCYFQHSSKHEEYIRYVEKIFSGEGLSCHVGKYLSKNSSTYFWQLATQRTIQLKEIYDRWYKNRVKIVPADLELTNSTIKNWIMDDGSLDKRDGILSLHTNAFTTDECWSLVSKLYNIVHTGKINVILCKGKYPKITISRITTNELLDNIGKCEVSCFDYKWDKKVLKKDSDIWGGTHCSV